MSGQVADGAVPRRAPGRWADRALDGLESERTCWAVLGVAMAGYAVLAMWLTRGTTLFVDGMQIFTDNRGLDPAALLDPLNGHLVLLERSVYAAGFALFGTDFVVFRLIETAGAILAVALLFVYLRRRVGPPAALAAALLLLFLGSAWEVTIVQDVETNVYSTAFGIGALLALDRGDRRGDVLACVLVALSIAAWTLGLAFAVIVAVLIATRPRWPSRLWVVAVPLVLYVTWFAWVRIHLHGESQNIALANVLLIPNFVANEAAAVAGALTGLNYDFGSNARFKPFATTFTYGAPMAAIAVAAIAIRIRHVRTSAALWAGLAGLLVFWVILALAYGGGRSPATVRYVYPGAILAFVVAAEAWRGSRPSRIVVAGLAVVTVLAIGANLARLRDGADYFRTYDTGLRAQLAALEIARNQVDPTFEISTYPGNFVATPAATYLAAVDRNGSPADTVAELAGQSERTRERADSTLVAAERIALAPAGPGALGGVHGCRTAGGVSTIRLVVPPGRGLLLRSEGSASVGARRFAGSRAVPLGTVSAGALQTVELPADEYAGAWYIEVRPTAGSVSACRL